MLEKLQYPILQNWKDLLAKQIWTFNQIQPERPLSSQPSRITTESDDTVHIDFYQPTPTRPSTSVIWFA